ncbi:hypothetical protein D556_0888 [Bordetella holmesii 41130]|nr:hypothetical protein D558_0879 [Bordetella holmesii 44057]EWM43857.1 hypothetical protein D556_0888 [Bordetella holmesii 41130]EWM46126.1 hypothetical protein D555_0899 [Bordetella holmesii 35009]EWM50278.1 hypothetical protein D557_0121 [Bordetella holmesii 70147]KAK80891.1 hypothetical protein L573_2274 [Bordetella holmesii H620]KAK83662.1 hypothetical protein L503_2565 [Bordetella holmesii CDC-H809-BH]KCV10476.1 hypothetical protein AZ25_2400 [Bordetella holmesii 04P3421]
MRGHSVLLAAARRKTRQRGHTCGLRRPKLSAAAPSARVLQSFPA